MQREEIEKKVIRIIKENSGLDRDISLDTRLSKEEINVPEEIELILKLEEEFGIEIPNKDLDEYIPVNVDSNTLPYLTVKDVVDYFEKRL